MFLDQIKYLGIRELVESKLVELQLVKQKNWSNLFEEFKEWAWLGQVRLGKVRLILNSASSFILQDRNLTSSVRRVWIQQLLISSKYFTKVSHGSK